MRFRNLIADYAKGRIVLLSTHIVSDVEAIADRILLMKNGAIADEGTVAELSENARGKVWTVHTDGETARQTEAVYNVANLRHEGQGVELRLITADPPAGAAPADPTLGGCLSVAFCRGGKTMTLFWWELKKILRRRMTRLLLVLCLAFAAVGPLTLGFANLGFGTDVEAPTWGGPGACNCAGPPPMPGPGRVTG